MSGVGRRPDIEGFEPARAADPNIEEHRRASIDGSGSVGDGRAVEHPALIVQVFYDTQASISVVGDDGAGPRTGLSGAKGVLCCLITHETNDRGVVACP